MKSQWYELKPAVLALRRNGKSLTFIEANLGIPKSTLSGWCKDTVLTNAQRQKLASDKVVGLSKAQAAAAGLRQRKRELMNQMLTEEANRIVSPLEITTELIQMVLAILLVGKNKGLHDAPFRSDSPDTIAFYTALLKASHYVKQEEIIYELHLQGDKDEEQEMTYWSQQLAIPRTRFKLTRTDRMSSDSNTNLHGSYCRITHPDVAIQQKLVYLYKSFSKRIISIVGD